MKIIKKFLINIYKTDREEEKEGERTERIKRNQGLFYLMLLTY